MIVGRVDEMRKGKVHGWAFNRDNRTERLEIRIKRGDEIVATGIADAFREDLPDAGVGDGKHAFGIEVPPTFASFLGLTIVACAATGAEVELAIANNDERRFDSLFANFSRQYDDLLIAMKKDIDGVRADAAGPVLSAIEERLAAVEKRLEDFEIFVIRLDEITRTLQERVGLLRPKGFFSRFRRKA